MSITYRDLVTLRRAHLRAQEREEVNDQVNSSSAVIMAHLETSMNSVNKKRGKTISSPPRINAFAAVTSKAAASSSLSAKATVTCDTSPSLLPTVGSEHPSVAVSRLTTSLSNDPRVFRESGKAERGADGADNSPSPTRNRSGVPKVFASFNTVRGSVPRPEQERRRHKLFSSVDVERMLAQKGINPRQLGNNCDGLYERALPIEAFDDELFEELSPVDWLAKGLRDVDPDDSSAGEHKRGRPLQCGVACTAYCENRKTHQGRWVLGSVMDWNVQEQRLLVEIPISSVDGYESEEDAAEQEAGGVEAARSSQFLERWLPRLYVCFAAEDPTRFVERFAAAAKKRREAVENMQYCLFVESMPVDASQILDDKTEAQIKDLALNTQQLLDNQEVLSLPQLIEEVRAGFARANNAQLFDHVNANSTTVAQLFPGAAQAALTSAPTFGRLSAPRSGLVSIPDGGFSAVVRAFHLSTFLSNQDEVWAALQGVRRECAIISGALMLVTGAQARVVSPLALEDFDELQTTAIHQWAMQLKESWAVKVREHVRSCLSRAGEDCDVSLHVSNKVEYNKSALKRFLTFVRFLMEDTLRFFVTASLEEFVQFIERCANFKITINDLDTIEVSAGPLNVQPEYTQGEKDAHLFVHPPLFSISVREIEPVPLSKEEQQARIRRHSEREIVHAKREKLRQDGEMEPGEAEEIVSPPASPTIPLKFLVQYETSPEDFAATLQAIVCRALTASHEVPQIETQLLNFVYNPSSFMIKSIEEHDPLVTAWLQRISTAAELAISPLHSYLDCFEQFRDIIGLCVPDYLEEVSSTLKLRDWELQARKWGDRATEILNKIPLNVNINFFCVHLAAMRMRIAEKCSRVRQGILKIMAQSVRSIADRVNEGFAEMNQHLARPLMCPEDIVECKEYLKALPEQVFELKQSIGGMSEIGDALDRFQYALLDEDFSRKMQASAWPARLEEAIRTKNEQIEQSTASLIEQMGENQVLFLKDVENLQKEVHKFSEKSDIRRIAEIAEQAQHILDEIQRLRAQASLFNTHEQLFLRERTDYSNVHALSKDFDPYATLWITSNDWTMRNKEWMSTEFSALDAQDITTHTMNALKSLQKCSRDPKLKDKPAILQVADTMRQRLEKFKPILPLLRFLRTEGMRDRHWESISKELGFEVYPGTTLNTIDDIRALKLDKHEHAIMEISEVAAREFDIERSLREMADEWQQVRMGVKPHKKTGCFILPKESFDDTQELLDNQMLMTQSLSFSPAKKLFEADIERWEQNIKLVQSIFDEWKVLQKAWLYLEPIFQSEDIARQLPQENKRFHQVNKNWKTLTVRAQEVDLTMPFCVETEDCLQIFQESNRLMEKVQKGLNQYLENKRASFARFYFLSDDELLGILSEAKDPRKLQTDFRKLFENVFRIDMRAPDNEMFGMYSQMNEYIPFKQTVLPTRNVENWLTDIEIAMKRSIRAQLAHGVEIFSTMNRKDFLLNTVGQVALAVNQIFWTSDCEHHLVTDGSLESYVKPANANLMLMVETVRQQLTALQQVNLGAMITVEVHARDIVEKLFRDKVSSVQDFDWVSQLRSYWEEDQCVLRQVEARFVYGCESLGNTTRLVITPLTDRIYLTLTGAMHMFLGGAPAGPAGTGKTETVKDLAKAVAKQCVVFNCQEGMTFSSLGKFFKGLASAGAWACFDEFNRIDVEVLSVVAQQVGSLQEAARSAQYRIPFEGTEIVVDPTYSVFITMNPGYAGRTELPDNLKVLFRPVACMVPDYAMIAEIRLFSYGYADSRKLAQKMVATFRLSSEQLSSQDHYDFGMRAVNTVISAAGLMKRQNVNESEDILLLRALSNSNSPKFLKEDLILFNGIISDLFPSIGLPEQDYGMLRTTLEAKIAENMLQPTDCFVRKCVEVFEMSILRHGQMSVGPTMGGKSCVTRMLAQALTALNKEVDAEKFPEVETYFLNPKSVTMAQLYGGFDEATAEWRDGLVGELFRIAANRPNTAKQWIVFDGPVDALWIESMNTVLDDNKKLCLISGEIIAMSHFMNIMFEVEDLAVASPATVSRAGMIYMEPVSCIGVDSLIRSWIMYRLPPTFEPYAANLQKLCEILFPRFISFVQTTAVEYNPTVWPNLVLSCFNIFNVFLEPFTPTNTYEVPEDKLELLREVHQPLLVFAMTWSFGATGDQATRKKFCKLLRDELKQANSSILLPDFGLLHDYQFNVDERRWVSWTELAPAFTAAVTANNYADILVPTADVIRYEFVNRILLSKSVHTLNVGPTGTGKSVIISRLLFTGMPSEFTPIFFTFSARTSANQTQDLIFSKFEARRRASPQIWGAPFHKRFVIFVDDLNMPLLEQYGAQPPLELLRQLFDYQGWYDRKTREFFFIADVVLTSAMGPPGGGRNRVSNRVLRHFCQIAFPEVEDENMRTIFLTLLESYFKPFSDDVRAKLSTVVTSCIEVYATVTAELRPTPSRPHYLFNLRDLASVIGGLLSATPRQCTTELDLAKLYVHEAARIFRDRLVDDTDRGWYDALMEKQLQTHFRMKLSQIVGESSRLVFCDFGRPNGDVPVYEEVADINALVTVCDEQLAEYNAQNAKQMDLVMFLDAVEHTCRIARVLKKPSGHLLLLGVGGSGRQSLARFAAFLTDLETCQIEIVKGYSMTMWRDDLKAILRKVSFNDKQALFLITDTQIAHEGMLEDVNSLLNSGEVPNLFVGSDVDEILNAMKPICSAEGVNLDKVSMYARFVRFCKTNLHVAIAMSPIGEPFRNRVRMFPALINCCTIDWFSAWSQQALESVPKNTFKDVEELRGDDKITQCVTMCKHMHQSVEIMSERFARETQRRNYVTPTSYLELLHCFVNLIHTHSQLIHEGRSRLQNGLEKLRQTEVQVAELQHMLAESQPVLKRKQEDIAVMVEEMKVEAEKAEETRREAAAEQAVAENKQRECAKIESDAQAILDEALPALDKALEALGRLQPQQLNEVASYRVPTSGVKLTVQALCILFQCKIVMKAVDNMPGGKKEPDYWQTAKDQLFTNMVQLMERLKNFHKDMIPVISEKVISTVEPLVKDPNFTPDVVKNSASVACVAMCEWAHAMHKYYFTDKQVKPLRSALAVAQAERLVSEEKLASAQAQLQEVEEKLARLNAQKEAAEAEMRTLEENVKTTEVKLLLAGKLIDGLAGEKKNWQSTIARLNEEEGTVMGDMLVAAGQISYAGAFSSHYRAELVVDWTAKLTELNISHKPKLALCDILQQPVQTRDWVLHSLPADSFSVENAIILTNSRRWPLMIDPQLQANKWVRDTYGEQLEVVKPSNKDCIKRIEHCIRGGRPALMEGVTDQLDPALDPLLARQTFMQGGQMMIRITDTAIPWNPAFKFFMTTMHSNPHYTPEAMVKVTLLNFFITPQGLEDQLLGVLVGRERKELEEQKVFFVTQNARMKAQIEEIQSTILRKLDEVTGDILDDEELINYLDESKRTTAEIAEKVLEAEATEREIDLTREGYRSVAFHSSILYFTCSKLSNVDDMYHYSMQWFVQLFVSGIDNAEQSEELPQRLDNLKRYLTYSFYQNVSRSLFEKHKLMFSLMLCVKILEGAGKLDTEAFSFLTRGAAEQLTTTPSNPAPEWLTEVTWKDIWYLDQRNAAYKGFAEDFKNNIKAYHDIFLSTNAHREKLPGKWDEQFSALQKMMFLRCLRPDKIMDAMQDFVSDQIGEEFIKPPQFDLAVSFKDSNPQTPLIFILSQGADPFEDWKQFAETQRMSKKLSDISLGQGQGPRAERLVTEGVESGMWVLLQNCHLATSWMPTLARLVEGISAGAHPQFRLWLTSMPNPGFPVSILQNGVKMTNEPPKGIRANVTRSLLSYQDSFFESSKQPRVLRKLTFSMCFFHALIQERRKFGPLGWNIAYEYTSGDLTCCVQQTKMFLEKYTDVPYVVMRELAGQIHYGGRVTDDWDRRTLVTMLETFVQPEVLEDGFKFSESGIFYSIPDGPRADYLAYVDGWPLNVSPEVFGLHENADITCARNETQETMETIVKLEGGGGGGSGSRGARHPDEILTELAQSILKRVRAPFDIVAFQQKYPTKYEDSMSTVLVQEAIRFNRLLGIIHSSLQNIQLAIKGLVVLSTELEAVYSSMLINQVPAAWAERAYPSMKPLASWISDLVARLAFIEKWYQKGHPFAYWISGFYFPQAFITGILQNYARRQQISIDSISHGFEWVPVEPSALTAPPECGCFIYGMFIEGARIDRQRMVLAESHPKVLFEPTPMLWLKPLVDHAGISSNMYKCPLYKTVRRAGTLSTTGHSTNYVLSIEIETGGKTWKHWVKRGVACICALND